jgi:hypothetical protein
MQSFTRDLSVEEPQTILEISLLGEVWVRCKAEACLLYR